PQVSQMLREEQNANVERSRLSRQLALMQAVVPQERDAAAIAATKRGIERINATHAVLEREIAQRLPEYRRLSRADDATLSAARQVLRDDEALIAIQSLSHSSYRRHRLFVWAFRRTGPVAFQMVDLPMGELAASLKIMRRGLEPEVTTLQDI